MFKFKKSALSTVLLMGMAASVNVNAASTATVIWSGVVPATNPSDVLIITGLGGDTTALTGTITPSTDGIFESDAIVLESHLNDGDVAVPVIGALAAANWTIVDAAVTFDGIANPAQVIEVDVNGAPVIVGDVVSGVETIATKVKQTAVLPADEIGGTTVQASVTVMADLV
ncbi:hypothetical protein BCU33_013080 [Vibrio lentus]|uniref:hypothetical protein n=1 Tax=Vibrio lentus TaxID=136468 RepID=UPI000C83B759|nr:hypothetical protein [Vibrio lentus]MCC4784505.1 hypothetical protein [Vibrio lentus]PMI92256.1 hypothetical protein BCU33_09665 [Vibrio lentus]PMJ06112.1 hypothetical protein BCU31_03365 [Vibrio lentus]TKG19620.1 hypothetical protein FCW05_09040 [Vibrio lentus]